MGRLSQAVLAAETLYKVPYGILTNLSCPAFFQHSGYECVKPEASRGKKGSSEWGHGYRLFGVPFRLLIRERNARHSGSILVV
jgi:hypothetical protein